MADDERTPTPEPQPYEPPAIADVKAADAPLVTAPGGPAPSNGGGIG
jgi:hypothetical protein